MHATNFIKAGLFALVVSVIAIVSWEFYLRHEKMPLYYDDNEALWADKRAMVYEPRDKATVFIGSSRIKYDLDIPTWQANTGDHAIQLANVGSSPRPVLEDLANDKNFAGKLIIDVTEGLFFADFSPNDAITNKKIAYFRNRTPTQRFSFQVDRVLESQLIFLDQENFSLNAMMDQLKIPHRPGVFEMPIFPIEFEGNYFTRQSYMTPKFLADTSLQNRQTAIWRFFASIRTDPPPSGDKLEAILNSVKLNVDKIVNRGGQVIFVRTPSSGPYLMGEEKGFPRTAYWDRLLAVTGCKGIHFKDYPAIAHFVCPEWSHLASDDALIFTKNLIKILQDEKGWSFSKTNVVH
jgi:hypothetical protein